MIDKIMAALPVELDEAQRAELVRTYAERITGGKASWLAAIHQRGEDHALAAAREQARPKGLALHNPPAHIVIRDRDPETGKRVAKLSDKGTVEKVRALWEQLCNEALEAAGRAERIDRRPHKAREASTELRSVTEALCAGAGSR